ncbi:hypothetical protein GCM10028789_06950 [Sinomonas halotolerans]
MTLIICSGVEICQPPSSYRAGNHRNGDAVEILYKIFCSRCFLKFGSQRKFSFGELKETILEFILLAEILITHALDGGSGLESVLGQRIPRRFSLDEASPFSSFKDFSYNKVGNGDAKALADLCGYFILCEPLGVLLH